MFHTVSALLKAQICPQNICIQLIYPNTKIMCDVTVYGVQFGMDFSKKSEYCIPLILHGT